MRCLAQCLHAAGVHLAGIQEARTDQGVAKIDGYVRFASGSDRGNYGVELWVHTAKPYALSSGQNVYLQQSHCTVLHAEPTMLIARIGSGVLDWNVAVLHAPHRSHTVEHRRSWWKHAEKTCLSLGGSSQWCILMDGNARVGSITSECIGDYEPDEQDDSGELMHTFLQAVNSFAPSTFTAHMHGSSKTMMQKRNKEWVRSDYVALPATLVTAQVSAWTDHGVSAGHVVLGHVALLTRVSYFCRTSPARKCGRPVRIDPVAIRHPDNAQKIREIIWDTPVHDWTISVHQQAAEMVDHMYQQLSRTFPQEARRLRRGYFSDKSGVLHSSLCAARKRMWKRRWALNCTYLRCAFMVWRRLREDVNFMEICSGSWLHDLKINIALDGERIYQFGSLLRYSCKDDRRAYVDKIVGEVEHADMNDVYKHLHCLIKPRRFRRAGMDPLPQLKKLDGNLRQSAAEYMHRWREHFSALEGGHQVHVHELVQNCVAAQAARAEPLTMTYEDIPSIEDLVVAMRGVRSRKAAGPDLLPPDICRAFSFDLALVWWPVLMKSTCRGTEPIGFKGGSMQRLPKPTGDRLSCSSQRGVLLQPAISKALQKSMRKLAMMAYEEDALDFQIGGRKSFSALFGSLATRSLLRMAKREKQSCSIVYVDLAAAYYASVWELIFGWSDNVSLEEITASLHVTPDDLQCLAALVREAPVLQKEDGRHALTRLGRELHDQTWFILKDDCEVVSTRRGTRPGTSWADCIFNLLFAKAVRRKRPATTSDTTPRLWWDGQRSILRCNDDAESCLHTTELSEIIFADDLAACSLVTDPAQIERATIDITCDLITTFHCHGLRANFGKTKTACTISVNGQGCREVRRRLFGQLNGRLPVLMEHGSTWVEVVPQYKHLGAVVCQTGSLRPEILRRLNIARANMKQGKRFIFGNKSISMHKRLTLFRSHVLSALLHGAGSWHVLSEGEFQSFAGGIMALFRQVLSIPATDDQHWSRQQILGAVGVPGPQALLRIERLRFMPLLLRRGPDSLWALLRRDEAVNAGMRAAFSWVYERLQHTVPLRHPFDDWVSWRQQMLDKPGVWKGWIKRAAAIEVHIQNLEALQDVTMRQIWTDRGTDVATQDEYEHACLKCGVAFSSRQRWGAHACRSHGYKARHTQASQGRRCTIFSGPGRLRRHLQHSICCLHAYNIGAIDDGIDHTAGHDQAPPLHDGDRPIFEAICHELLAALRETMPKCENDLLDTIKAFIAPIDELRRTLHEWCQETGGMEGEIAAALLAKFNPAGLGLHAHAGFVAPKHNESFRPTMMAFPSTPNDALSDFMQIGLVADSWIAAHALSGHTARRFCFWQSESQCEVSWAAVYIVCPCPPLQCRTLTSPISASLKGTRKFVAWSASVLRHLATAGTAARRGAFVRVEFCGLQRSQLGEVLESYSRLTRCCGCFWI